MSLPGRHSPNEVILPGSTIGILGGGQLGRMMAMAARSLGYRVQVMDPDPSCPARFVVDSCFAASFDDVDAAADLARGCDVVTIEIEKIGLDAMRAAAEHSPVRPDAHVLEIIQNRARQKEWLASQAVPIGEFRVVRSADELGSAVADIASTGRSFLKTTEGGYDGRGQTIIGSPSDSQAAWSYLGADVCVLETEVKISQEISVLAARNPRGEVAIFPPSLNHHQDRILDWAVIPAPISSHLAAEATSLANQIVQALDVIGLLTVEMFVRSDGKLLVNELAPRPHNSFHSTERACATSQFEQAIRAVCNLPLGSVEILRPAAIVNLLGEVWLKHTHPRFDAALSVPGVRLHLYEKQVPKPGRKMGHLSAIGNTPEEAIARVQQAKAMLD